MVNTSQDLNTSESDIDNSTTWKPNLSRQTSFKRRNSVTDDQVCNQPFLLILAAIENTRK
jgi:hypothetical protein